MLAGETEETHRTTKRLILGPILWLLRLGIDEQEEDEGVVIEWKIRVLEMELETVRG